MGFRIVPVCCFLGAALLSAAADNQAALKRQAIEKYAAAPVLFVENRGQAPDGVDFVSSGFGRRITTRPSGFDVYVPHKISIGFVRSNKAGRGQLLEPTAARSGFMLGKRQASGLVNYKKVRYDNVWPGAGVVYYGTGRALEYDVVLQPGADLGRVKLQFTGAQPLRIDSGGGLVLKTAGREIVQRKPSVYQEIDGRRVEVVGGYRIGRGGRVGFEVAAYDHAHTLVIDPILSWMDQWNSLNGSLVTGALGIAVDGSGNAYIVGETFAPFPSNHGGIGHGFLMKLNPSGSLAGTQSQSFEIGGGGTTPTAVAVDDAGNIYIVGSTEDTDLTGTCPNCGFQPNHSAGTLICHATGCYPNNDGFLISLKPSFATNPGNAVNYVTYMGGTDFDNANGVAVVSPGVVYVAGSTASTDFPKSIGSGLLAGTQNAFLVKVDTTQMGPASKVWARYVGGNSFESGQSVATDTAGNAYLVGMNGSIAGFTPFSSTGFQTSALGGGFLDKIDPSGTTSLYFTYFVNGVATSVAVSGATAYITGSANGVLGNVTASAYQSTFAGGYLSPVPVPPESDAFLFRVDTSQTGASSLIYSTYLGGAGYDVGTGVAVDANGKASVVGIAGPGFPLKNAIQSTVDNAFYAQFDTTKSGPESLISSTYLGGPYLGDSGSTNASGVALNGNAVLVSAYTQESVQGGARFVIGGAVFRILGVAPLQLVTVAPCRVLDTRNAAGPLGGPFLAAGVTRTIPIPLSGCGIPANAVAYSLNTTVEPRTGPLGYLTVWPAGQSAPGVSTLNSLDGSTIANAAIVPAGTNGAINAFATNDTELIIDINGYFVPPASNSLQFYPLTPCRVADTRNPNGPFGGPTIAGGNSRTFTIPASACGVPSNAAAYAFNVTVVPHGFLGYVTAWPSGQAQPGVSTLNSFDGTILANAAIVPAGSGGAVSFYASNTTDLVVDINGYFAPPSVSGLNFYAAPPCRVVDTRGPNDLLSGPIAGGGMARTFPLAAGACGLPSSAQAYSLNMTVVPQTTLGYLSTWATGGIQPAVSTLNDFKGLPLANAAIVPAGGGAINVFVTNPTQLIIDANGYFAQ